MVHALSRAAPSRPSSHDAARGRRRGERRRRAAGARRGAARVVDGGGGACGCSRRRSRRGGGCVGPILRALVEGATAAVAAKAVELTLHHVGCISSLLREPKALTLFVDLNAEGLLLTLLKADASQVRRVAAATLFTVCCTPQSSVSSVRVAASGGTLALAELALQKAEALAVRSCALVTLSSCVQRYADSSSASAGGGVGKARSALAAFGSSSNELPPSLLERLTAAAAEMVGHLDAIDAAEAAAAAAEASEAAPSAAVVEGATPRAAPAAPAAAPSEERRRLIVRRWTPRLCDPWNVVARRVLVHRGQAAQACADESIGGLPQRCSHARRRRRPAVAAAAPRPPPRPSSRLARPLRRRETPPSSICCAPNASSSLISWS